MSFYYALLASLWTLASALHWQSLLRVQFFIFGVILLGMLEKALFYFQFYEANRNGIPSLSLALVAELVSCFYMKNCH